MSEEEERSDAMHKGQFGAGAILSGGVERLKRELCGVPMMMMIKLSTPQELRARLAEARLLSSVRFYFHAMPRNICRPRDLVFV